MSTFTQIVNDVADELNLTSPTALARIGRTINKRYKQICSSLGLETTMRGTATVNTVGDSVNRFVTFPGVADIFAVLNPGGTNLPPLSEALYDDLLNQVAQVGTSPALWAKYRTTATSMTIALDVVPSSIYAVTVDALLVTPTLSGDMTPAFSEDFHDLLELGAKVVEFTKKDQPDESTKCEVQYERRMGELRLFLAKSAYLDLYQGKASQGAILPLLT